MAGSELLLAVELPLLVYALAQFPGPEANLAGYEGVVMALTLAIAAPALQLLVTSTALSENWPSYLKLQRFALLLGGILVGLHALVAFTPLYRLIVASWMAMPADVIEPSRLGLMILAPLPFCTALRAVGQGALIRHGRTRTVGTGTLMRLLLVAAALGAGFTAGGSSAIGLVSFAVMAGAAGETAYIAGRAGRLMRGIYPVPAGGRPAISYGGVLALYLPLALTELISIPVHPARSAALSRMPDPLESLAVFAVLHSLFTVLAGLIRAFERTAVALLDRPGGVRRLSIFGLWLAGGVTLVMVVLAASPYSEGALRRFLAFSPHLSGLARQGLRASALFPAIIVAYSFFQAVLIQSRRTWPIPVGLVIFVAVNGAILGLGVVRQTTTGVFVGLAAMQVALLIETVWSWWWSRPALNA